MKTVQKFGIMIQAQIQVTQIVVKNFKCIMILVPAEYNALLQKLVFFILMWKSLFRLSSIAVSVLMKFLHEFLCILGKAFNCPMLSDFSSSILISMIKCERFLKLNYGVKKFVVCPKCDSLYDFQDCILEVKGKKESKKCHHGFFPSKTRQCKSLLLKTNLSSNCRQKFVSFKLYAYKSRPWQRRRVLLMIVKNGGQGIQVQTHMEIYMMVMFGIVLVNF